MQYIVLTFTKTLKCHFTTDVNCDIEIPDIVELIFVPDCSNVLLCAKVVLSPCKHTSDPLEGVMGQNCIFF